VVEHRILIIQHTSSVAQKTPQQYYYSTPQKQGNIYKPAALL